MKIIYLVSEANKTIEEATCNIVDINSNPNSAYVPPLHADSD
jgi:hypothetical protein